MTHSRNHSHGGGLKNCVMTGLCPYCSKEYNCSSTILRPASNAIFRSAIDDYNLLHIPFFLYLNLNNNN